MLHAALIPRFAAAAARSIMRPKPAVDSGAPRSNTNTKGDAWLSCWCRRSSCSSDRVQIPSSLTGQILLSDVPQTEEDNRKQKPHE
jgi:hypothetical protein